MFKSMNVQFPLKVTRFATAMPEVRDNINKLVLSINQIVGSFHYRDDVAKILQSAVDGLNAKYEEAKKVVEDHADENMGIEKEIEEKSEPVKIEEKKKGRGRPKKNA